MTTASDIEYDISMLRASIENTKSDLNDYRRTKDHELIDEARLEIEMMNDEMADLKAELVSLRSA